MNKTKTKTELVFILDRSGSMSGLETDTIGGFNSMLEKQQRDTGECRITTVLFDDQYEILHDRLDLAAVSKITTDDYYVRGSTALIDAIGRTIKKIETVQKMTTGEHRADKVLFVIITDGHENASRKYRAEQVKQMIEYQKSEFGWEFIYLGANIDAVETASHIGISAERAQSYHADSIGIEKNFAVVSEAVNCLRSNGEIQDDWKQSINADYERRKKRAK